MLSSRLGNTFVCSSDLCLHLRLEGLAFTQDSEYLLAGSTTGDVAVILMKNRVVEFSVRTNRIEIGSRCRALCSQVQTFVAVCGGGVVNLVARCSRTLLRPPRFALLWILAADLSRAKPISPWSCRRRDWFWPVL